MPKKKVNRVGKKVDQEEYFRFALNAAVLAVLIGVLVMLVSYLPYMQYLGSKAAGY